MFKNSDSDNDIEAGHTRSGRVFREVHLVNLFKKNYEHEVFYSEEVVNLKDEEHLESAREEEGKVEEPHREDPETSGTMSSVEVTTIIPHVVSTTLSNQSNQSQQSTQSTVTSSPLHIQSGNLGRSMDVTHYFGHPNDDFTSICSCSQHDFFPKKTNFFPPLQGLFLERVRRMHILHSAKIYDFRKSLYSWPEGFRQAAI
jgi:hypothetical protein